MFSITRVRCACRHLKLRPTKIFILAGARTGRGGGGEAPGVVRYYNRVLPYTCTGPFFVCVFLAYSLS